MGDRNERTLSLLHLRKTFSEYNRISLSGAKEIDPNRLLPLFKNVSAMYKPVELRSEFKEAPSFSLSLSSYFVREIRTRASTEGTEDAAVLIADYLLPSPSQNRGFAILTTLHFLLQSEDDSIVDALCKSSFPSTIVKSLYLFFDLPIPPVEHIELRNELNDLLTSMMKRLCTYKAVSEELTKKDDLALLFIAVSSVVKKDNLIWRKTCCSSLDTLGRKGLSPVVIKYIKEKECIGSYLLNMQQDELSTQEKANMFITLFSLLKDSSSISTTLCQSFSAAGGFDNLKTFIMSNESESEMIRSILSMLVSLLTSGPQPLKPSSSSGLISLPSFQMPIPSGEGLTVRSSEAFVFLFHLYCESTSSSTHLSIIDLILSIYSSDHINYFILDRFLPFSSFIERLVDKDPTVQLKIIDVTEFLLFQLSYIPCKELIALSVQSKTELSVGKYSLPISFIQSSFKLLTVDPLIKDAFREVGILDTLSYSISHLFEIAKKRDLTEEEYKLALLSTDLLTVSIKGNMDNCRVFSDGIGAKGLLQLVVLVQSDWRSSSLQLLKQLLLLSSCDAYISSMLTAINTSSMSRDIPLTSELLKSLLGILRESHKVRLLFRRSGGYICLVSLLLSLESSLSPSSLSLSTLPPSHLNILDFINLIFKVLTISMRFEPSNAKFFSVEVNWESVTTVLRLTGAFTQKTQMSDENESENELKPLLVKCHQVFRMDEDIVQGVIPDGMPSSVFYHCYLIRLLFNMSLDNYERQASEVSFSMDTSLEDSFISWPSSVLVHPGAILSLLQLIPSIETEDIKWTVSSRLYSTLLVKSLLRPERNQQLMCQMEMPQHLLSIFSSILLLNHHILLPPVYYLLERLSYQSMLPRQLRQFLRLDLPLCCRNLDEKEGELPLRPSEGGPVPLSRVKALVSMMTPRDKGLSSAPSFIEWDMMHEGFGCLFIPSLAPLPSSNRTDRMFPPLNGLTYSFWLYVDSFSDKKSDAHPLRLLTISRVTANAQRTLNTPLAALTIQLSSIDRSLLISTEELENAGCDLEKDGTFPSDKMVRIPLVENIREQEWNHLCIVLSRSVLKNSQVTVYLNARPIASHKMQYIVQNVGGGTSQLGSTVAVNAIIGTPPSMRRPSRLRWRMSSIFLLEESLSTHTINRLFSLRPHYIGNMQCVIPHKGPLLSEDKIILSLNGVAVDELTLSKIRGLHCKLDADMTAGLLGLNPSDNSTPLRVILNASSHLSGCGRSFGAIVVGYLGMRSFAPRPVPLLIDSIGGYASLFALVPMSTDSEGLYAALKAIVSAVKSNWNLYESISSNRAFQMLGVLIEDKAHLLNSHILHLIFSLVGTLDTERDSLVIPHVQAFEDLLTDLDVWSGANDEMLRMILDHIYELITDGRNMENVRIIRSSSLLSRLLFTILDRPSLLQSSTDSLFNLICAICRPPMDDRSILKLGQFIAYTLPSTQSEVDEERQLSPSNDTLYESILTSSFSSSPSRLALVYTRNRLLCLLDTFLSNSSPSTVTSLCDQIMRVLGFDWLLAMMAPNVNDTTVFLSLKMLLLLLSKPSLLHKFKEGNGNGGWLTEADCVVRNTAATVLGFSVSADVGSIGSRVDINPEVSTTGFTALQHILAAHYSRPYVYIGMFSLLVGQPVNNLRNVNHFDVDMIWSEVFGLKGNSSIFDAISSTQFCFDSLYVLFSIIRSCLYSRDCPQDIPWRTHYPCTILQVFTFLYQNSPSFFSICHTDDFVVLAFSSLISEESEETNKEKEQSIEIDLNSQLPLAVLNLLKRIIMDEMQSNVSKKERLVDSLLEIVLESPSSSRSLHQSILSTLFLHVFNDILATDLLVSSSLPPHSTPLSSSIIRSNIFTFSSRIVDAMWNSVVIPSFPIKLLNTMYDMHYLSSQRGTTKTDMDILTNTMMRCILYILSRPIDSFDQQMRVLDTLSALVSKKYIYLQSNESWFFSSLSHLIFMLSITPDILTSTDELDKTSAQVAVASTRVWMDIVVSKKSLVEETLRRSSVTELNGARALLAPAASEYWRAFVEGQISRMTTNTNTNRPQLQLQMSERISQMTSGLSRLPLLSRRPPSTSTPINKIQLSTYTSVPSEVVYLWLRIHSSLIRQLVHSQSVRYHEWHSHVRKWCLHEWSSLEVQLTRERAIWGPDEASSLDKFRLDTTEGPGRLRRKLIPNRRFYHDYPYRPYLDDPSAKSIRAKVAISFDSKLYYEAQRRRRPKTIEEGIVEYEPKMISSGVEDKEEIMDLDKLKSSLMKRVAVRDREEKKEKVDKDEKEKMEEDGEEEEEGEDKSEEKEEEVEEEGKEEKEEKEEKNGDEKTEREEKKREKRGPDNQTLLRLLEEGEQLHSMFRCARIEGLDTAEGLLLFGKDHYYVVDGFTLLKTREIRDLDFLPPDLHDPIVPYTATGATSPPRVSRICSKFSYDNIREVHKRRYLLQKIALEVFSADGRNYLLAFPKRMRDRVYDKLVSMARGLRDGGKESVGGQRSSMAMEQTGRTALINSLIGQQSVTQRWLNGQISNFQYLMHLNTLAGRSYNDLSQYPVFPFVLSDYTSSTLDLSNPNSFRDLSRPMGAQTKERLDSFLKRYKEWDDPSGETPPYMYGTHYSSAMIVVSYLVRVEPFTQQFLSLQGGHFDLADRMFHSISDAWLSASKNNMADVKELIPEFFCLPEMFINKNKFDLGRKQSGITLDNVILPPWAKDDPREFVRIHRMALESDYVSDNLHEWIDLIFGYKQNGEQAVNSNNLFHHLFYEGNVNFDSIDDPLTRNATIGFVNNFGQIPSQLFKKPHPQKKVNTSPELSYCGVEGVTTNRVFYHTLHSLRPPSLPIKEVNSAVGAIQENEKGIIQALPQNRLFVGSNSSKYVAWSFPDRSIRIGSIDTEKSSCILELNDTSEFTCAAMGEERCLFLGSSDGTISSWNMDRKGHNLIRKKTLDAHSDAVTCLSVSSPHNMVVSASRDSTAIVWNLSDLSLIRQLPSHPFPVSALALNHSTGDIATACGMELFVWSINGDLLSTIRTGEYGPSDTPHIILTIAFSTLNEWDADNVIVTGGSDGVVSLFSSCVVENDGSLHPARLESKKERNCVTTMHSRLDRQRRRLRVGGMSTESTTTASSQSLSPDPPCSPISLTDRRDIDTLKDDKYVRILVHRASLTTHTAFSRSDNPLPAPITAITPSRDHKSLYVGDGVGRVWEWTMGEDMGGRSDHWIQDLARQRCTQCQHNFSIADRKHHCRNCGQIFCAKCSRFESHITHMKISRPVRVCQACFVRLKAQNSK